MKNLGYKNTIKEACKASVSQFLVELNTYFNSVRSVNQFHVRICRKVHANVVERLGHFNF